MYINKVDELIDRIIDDFYNSVIIKNRSFSKIANEQNFVKYQLDINKILAEYTKSIDISKVKDVISNENIPKILNIIKRYLAYYLFLTIAFNQPKNDTFVNNIIEFTKNQGTFNFKIDNFFNSENNSILIKFHQIVKNTVIVLDLEPSKLQIAANKPEFRDTIEFLNDLGQSFVVENFKIENLKGDKNLQGHNIIKTIIFSDLYMKREKKDVYDVILSIEKEKGEFTFIDIVLPKSFYIDYTAVENLLDEKETEMGMASDLFDFIQKNEDLSKKIDLAPEEKFTELIDNKIIVPVVDDFLLYHKDSEKYEKYTGPIDPKKRKEDTKVRYIVNKIDSVSDLYSDSVKKNPTLKKNIEKLFYVPLSDRNAVLMNDIEEIKIINKMTNLGKLDSESGEFYNDLLSYREYSYQNFKDFKDYGFSYQGDKTVTSVRYTSLEHKRRSNNRIECRVSNKDFSVNVVGVLVRDRSQPVECLKIKNIKDVRTLHKDKENGYQGTLTYLKKILSSDKKKNDPIFWKFDQTKDYVTTNTYQQMSKSATDMVKITVANLYDDLVYFIYSSVIDRLEELKTVDLYTGRRLIKHYQKKIFKIPENNRINNLLDKAVYFDKVIRTEKKYDKREDEFGGLFDSAIKLPVYKNRNISNANRIEIEQDFIIEGEDEYEMTEAEKVKAICQHFLSWDNIMAIRKKNPNEYGDLLYEFINQYVLENNEGDYVCKSCSTQLNIKKYITDGYYDRTTDKFTTFTMPLTVFLEDIPEYEKYKTTIRNIDKLVEKLSSIANISYYVGSNTSVKSRRKPVVKNVVDMLLKHNKIISKYYKNRHEKIDQLYGIAKNLTNLFVFELDNSIFTYSSKDKDFYKPIKHNNILTYAMFMLIIELSSSQILFMDNDKTCNFYWFDKYGHYFFDNLKIIINDKGDTKPIKNYPILCYVVFFMACLITKYKLWFFESKDNTLTKKKLVPIINRAVINTFVDITNSILEVNKNIKNKNKEKDNVLYTLICNRFFIQLNSTFGDRDLLKRMRKTDENKMSAILHTKKYITTKLEPIPLPDKYTTFKLNTFRYKKCTFGKYYPQMKTYSRERLLRFSNLTNCIDGHFHNWTVSDKTFKCSRCGRVIDSIKNIEAENQAIKDNLNIMRLSKLAEKFCITGEMHKYVFDEKKNKNVCVKCGYSEGKEISVSDLLKMDKNIASHKKVRVKKIKDRKEFSVEDYKTVVDIRKHLEKEGLDSVLNRFIDMIQSNVGQEVTLNGKKIFLKKDTYIIDHTPKGQLLDEPIIITDTSKIIYKKQHPYFKKDVLYYTYMKQSKMDVFYDASSFVLLGYKETNKQYEILHNSTRYLQVRDSILNRIKLLGYTNRFIPIDKDVDEFKDRYPDMKDDFIIRSVISDINRKRIELLKKTITDFQKYIYRLIYGYDEPEADYESADDVTRDSFMKKYYKKLTKIKVKDENSKNRVFGSWKDIDEGIYFNNVNNNELGVSIEDKTVSTDELRRVDEQGNIVLYYIVQELSKLLDYNPSKFIRANLVYFMLDALNNVYEFYNKDIVFKNNEVRRFTYLLATDKFIHDTQEQYMISKPEGFYGEYSDIDDKQNIEEDDEKYDDEQEMDAIDMENSNPEITSADDDEMILDPDNFEPND